MLLSELREAVESGKTVKLFKPKTHQHGIDLTIRVAKVEDQIIWQRGKIEEPLAKLNLPAVVSQFFNWDALLEKLRGSMQLRDAGWEICEERIEIENSQIEVEAN